MKSKKDGCIPTLHVKAESIPEAHWKAIKEVHENGYELRTGYDRKEKGRFIDPPGRDAKVMIEIKNPFSQPRYPIISYCERGKYIGEILGVKDHCVVPYHELLEMVRGSREFAPTLWPYCYHQRLTAYPKSDGSTLNQLELILNKLAENPITRRAVAITGVPEIDLFMKEDQPCLRYIQLRAIENEDKQIVLNMHISWRSRDLLKAWPDNVIGVTNLQERLAKRLQEKMARDVLVGPYTESNGSLHLYGQDYTEKEMKDFFEKNPSVESYVKRAWTSEKAKPVIVDELKILKSESHSHWKFPQEAIQLIDDLIKDYETGIFIP